MKALDKKIRLVLSVIAILFLSSCWQIETIIKIKRNGEAQITESVLFSKQFLAFLVQMKSLGGKTSAADGDKPVSDSSTELKKFILEAIDKKQFEEKARLYGEGVKLVTFVPIQEGEMVGYRVLYSVPDVNKLNFNPDSEPALKKESRPEASGDTVAGPVDSSGESHVEPEVSPSSEAPSNVEKPVDEVEQLVPDNTIRFKLKRGAAAELEILLPEEKKREISADESAEGDEGVAPGNETDGVPPQMMEMFRDMKMAIRVVVDGEVFKSDATYREGSTITLVEMDFSKMMKDREAFKDFMNKKPKTLVEIAALTKKIDGLKFETKKKVYVRFD